MSNALGILVPEYPQQTHVFFWREIATLREMGVDVAQLSTRRPVPGACRHDFVETALAETHYVYPPDAGNVSRLLASRPTRLLAALRYLTGLRGSSTRQRARALGLLMCAADLAAYSKRRGIRHIHAHSCADAAHIVAMTHLLGGPSYSLSLHGDLAVYGTDHRNKCRRALCISCAGQHLVPQLIEQAECPAARVQSNWMGVDTSRFVPRNPVDPSGPLSLLTVARLNRTKGHVHALRAMRRAIGAGKDLRYTIAGEGPHRSEIEAEIQRLDMNDQVEMLGTQSESQVLELLQTHDVFVLPSIEQGEAAPVSLMEAMSSGLPSVVSIIGSTPHMVEDGVSGILVAQADEHGLCDAFVRLHDDVDYRFRMGAAARERALKQFDCRKTTARFLAFIERHVGFEFKNVACAKDDAV